MALHDDIPNEAIEKAINSIQRDAFTTLTIVAYLEKEYAAVIEDLKGWSPRNWRAVIGKKIKVYMA